MSLLQALKSDRRVWLFGLLALLAVVVARFSISTATSVRWVVKGGYWMILIVFALFLYALWRAVREWWREFKPARNHLGVAALILASGGVLLAHERYGFKILADEALLLGTSMGIHFQREVTYPTRATNIQGPFQILQSVLDKRPFFFPFLVSLAHDFTGYRPENPFYVNTVLGFLFLGLLYAIGRRLGGTAWAGVLLVLLFAGLPLLSQQMKGGGFELLNLVMISVVLLGAMRFAERRDESSLDILCLAAVLLTFTRYESVIFLPPVALLVVWGWWREQRVILTWPVVLTPLALVFYLFQNRVFERNQASWELASVPGATTPFGLHYVGDNLGHALGFFFDTTGYQPNSPFFALVGLLAVPFFALWILRVVRAPDRAPAADVGVATVGLGLFGIWALLMVYFWGQFDHPLIRRLSLPVHLLMAVAVAVIGGKALRTLRGWQAVCGAALAALVVYSLPVMSRRAYANTYSPAIAMEWRKEFLDRYPERDYLFIDNDTTFWITHEVSATAIIQAKARKDSLTYLLRNHSFSSMYVMQHFLVDGDTGVRKLNETDDLGPDFELEPVWEYRIQTLYIGRISRVTAIKDNGKVVAEAGQLMPVPSPVRSAAEVDTVKKAFVDRYLKELP
jgi:hypothetical protein